MRGKKQQGKQQGRDNDKKKTNKQTKNRKEKKRTRIVPCVIFLIKIIYEQYKLHLTLQYSKFK